MNTIDLKNPFIKNGSSYDGRTLKSTWPSCCDEEMIRTFYSIGTYPNTEEGWFYCKKCYKFIEIEKENQNETKEKLTHRE